MKTITKINNNTLYQDEFFERINVVAKVVATAVFSGCRFRGCDFSDSLFGDCEFRNCWFENCKMNLWRLSGSEFAGCEFTDCDMTGIDWTAASLPKLRLCCPLTFTGCRLDHGSFIGLDLQELRATDCQLRETDFRSALLRQSVFENCDFSNSLFGNTDLRGADFSGARNYLINLAGNKCQNAKFSLPEALNLLTSSGVNIL
ncbi:MAG: pentapeptide repeat-containing protein [Negativicutes bacterium]|jgi:uncharacterized protein YjbI with pentapeptide repeats